MRLRREAIEQGDLNLAREWSDSPPLLGQKELEDVEAMLKHNSIVTDIPVKTYTGKGGDSLA